MQKSVTIEPRASEMRPDLIASGLGLASRQELCGLIALLETVGFIEAARGVGENLASRIGAEFERAEQRLVRTSNDLGTSSASDDVLRHRLWTVLVSALGTHEELPLSERRIAEEACALGVMTSQVLSPGHHAMQKAKKNEQEGRTGISSRMEAGLREVWADPSTLWRSDVLLPFPEIVARELAALTHKRCLSKELSADFMRRL